MPVFKLPLSGDVVQNISPFTAFMSPIGSQFGLINITLGQSSAPEVEKDVLSDYGTYGIQLGQIGDVDVVADAGAVRRGIIGAENLQLRTGSR